MASFLASPRKGHLETVFHIFTYLKDTFNTELVLDPFQVEFDKDKFIPKDWSNSPYGVQTLKLPNDTRHHSESYPVSYHTSMLITPVISKLDDQGLG